MGRQPGDCLSAGSLPDLQFLSLLPAFPRQLEVDWIIEKHFTAYGLALTSR